MPVSHQGHAFCPVHNKHASIQLRVKIDNFVTICSQSSLWAAHVILSFLLYYLTFVMWINCNESYE